MHDFKVCNSTCASDVTFRGYYGSANDGNACNPCNISDFTNKILHETDKIGVHFMMSDGVRVFSLKRVLITFDCFL